MRKIIIYPFDIYSVPYIRHSSLIDDSEIIGAVSPRGWGFCGKDACVADGGDNTGIIVSDNFEDALDICDTVLFIQSETPLDFEKQIYPKIKTAINKKKSIINMLQLDNITIQEVQELCSDKNISFTNYYLHKEKQPPLIIQKEYLFEICKPVVFVLGLCEGTHKFEIQLSLREKFINEGYRVCQIGSRNSCEFLGFHSFPDFMYSKDILESNKIVLFNHFVKQIEKRENPDVIMIGIPGGIMPINNNITNRFGILAYEVCQAVTPDSAILSIHYSDFDKEFLEKLLTNVRYKFNIEVNCYNLANKKLDMIDSENNYEAHLITIDHRYIENKKTQFNALNIPVYNVLSMEDRNKMTELVLNVLSKYGCIEYV